MPDNENQVVRERRPITEEDRATIKNDIASGSTISQVADKIGRAQTVVRRLAAQMGLVQSRSTPSLKGKLGRTPKSVTILTSDVKKRGGFYHCPDRDLENPSRPCKAKYSEPRFLGRHRTLHGVFGKSKSVLALRKSQTRKELNGNGHSHEVKATKSDSSYSATGPKGWTDESAAGYIFAHIQPIIEDGCKGSENSQPRVALRISELLSFEVLRNKERNRNLGSTLHLPGMRS